MRKDNRTNDEIRNVKISRNYLMHPFGSVLIEMGNTKVICTATIEDRVPMFLKNMNKGWLTSEYSMLPGATQNRKFRNVGKIDGRTQEIQRLIGRSLRSAIDLTKIGERTIWIDCDVIQADGGTRTASITGAYVAMVDAIYKLYENKQIEEFPISSYMAAISVGIDNNIPILDLCYEEDHRAIVDMNIVMTSKGEFIEVQGTGEEDTFSRDQLNKLLDLAEKGIDQLISIQKDAIGDIAKLIEEED